MVACIACDRDQARIVLGCIKSYFEGIPPLAVMVMRVTEEGFELANQVDILVMTGSFRSPFRSWALIAFYFAEKLHLYGAALSWTTSFTLDQGRPRLIQRF